MIFFGEYNKTISGKRGFTLFFAVLVSSLLLSIGIAIFTITFKQLVLSSSIRNSQFAFYAADTGVECVLYWDLRGGAFSTTTPPGPEIIDCVGNDNLTVGGNPVSEFELNFAEGYCAVVKVTKSGNDTTLESRGYNTCDENNPRRVERGIRVTY